MIYVVASFGIESIFPDAINTGPADLVISNIDKVVAQRLAQATEESETVEVQPGVFSTTEWRADEVASGLLSRHTAILFSRELGIELKPTDYPPVLTEQDGFLLGRFMEDGTIRWYSITRS